MWCWMQTAKMTWLFLLNIKSIPYWNLIIYSLHFSSLHPDKINILNTFEEIDYFRNLRVFTHIYLIKSVIQVKMLPLVTPEIGSINYPCLCALKSATNSTIFSWVCLLYLTLVRSLGNKKGHLSFFSS